MPTKKSEFVTSFAREALGHEAEVEQPKRKSKAKDQQKQPETGLSIVMLPIAELNPYARNPRNNEPAVEAVAASIREFGFKVPIILDSNREIVAGHTRLKAAKRLGMAEVPCIIADDLTPEQIRAFRLADNKVAELAEWDFDTLAQEMEAVMDEFNMEEFGFDMAEFETEEQPEVIEDDGEPENVATICQKGQVWQLGEHRLMCGDSTKAEDIARLMQDEQADLWLTDPPYNVALGWHMRPSEAKQLHRRTDGLVIENDAFESDDAFINFLVAAFKGAMEHLKPGGAFYIWHADNTGWEFRSALRQSGMTLRQCLVWVKNTIVLGRQDYQWKHEPCLYGWKDGAGHYFTPARNLATVVEEDRPDIAHMSKGELQKLCRELLANREQIETSVLYEDKPAKSEDHPTMKPIKLFARQIANSSRPGEIVLDTFGGSGTTIMAAEQLNRKARLMELDPHYCDVIIARWEKFTGLQAELIAE